MLVLLFAVMPFAVVFWPVEGNVFPYADLRWFLIFIASLGLLIGSFFGRTPLQIPDGTSQPWLRGAVVLATLGTTIACYLGFPGKFEPFLLWGLCFFIVWMCAHSWSASEEAFDFLTRRIARASAFGVVVVVGYLLLQRAGVFLPNLPVAPGQWISFFGNKNYAASYYSAALLIHIFYFPRSRTRVGRILFWMVLALGLYGLACMRGRGATLGFLTGLGIFFWPKLRWSLLRKGLLAVGLAAIIGLLLIPASYREVAPENDTRKIRLARWANTVELIREHPWGVGPGRFDWDYYPYSKKIANDWEVTEDIVTKSPHNLFLEIAAEFGVLTLLAVLGVLGVALIRAWRSRPGVVAVMAGILMDGFFSFPMRLPDMFFTLAVFCGFLTSAAFPSRRFLEGRLSSRIRGLLVLLLGFIGFLQFSAVWNLSVSMTEVENLDAVCSRAPWWVEACAVLCVKEANSGRWEEAEQTCRSILERQPHMVKVLPVLAGIVRAQGRTEEYCRLLKQFDGYFGYQSSVHPAWVTDCSPAP